MMDEVYTSAPERTEPVLPLQEIWAMLDDAIALSTTCEAHYPTPAEKCFDCLVRAGHSQGKFIRELEFNLHD